MNLLLRSRGKVYLIVVSVFLLFSSSGCQYFKTDQPSSVNSQKVKDSVVKDSPRWTQFFQLLKPASNNENSRVKEDSIAPVPIDLKEIRERGKLIAITSYSTTSYFLYRGQPMGYEYELLERLADHLNLELEIKIAYNLDNFFELLNKGEGDIVAHGLSITRGRKDIVDFTEHHSTTRQVLVQRKPENWRSMKVHQMNDAVIRDPLELIGKTVHVRRNTSYYQRLQNLSEEIGGNINIEPVEGNLETSEIIKKVANGEIKYTVADKNIAYLNKTYYSNLDVNTPLSFSQRLAWAVRKTSPELKEAVNNWIRKMRKETDYYVIYNKYFKNTKGYRTRIASQYFSKSGGKISEYDNLIKDEAQVIDWDWRLLASQIYQESRFDPRTKSWAGAMGLMQVMPRTASQFGKYNLYKPSENIRVGVKFIDYLQKLYRNIPDSTERMKFILASYNVGQGHVADARRLAKKYGKNPDIWTDHVDQFILLKSRPEYYSDPVVKYGYCRGQEPYNYVNEILGRYNTYKEFIENKGREISS